jgi:ComF family protein
LLACGCDTAWDHTFEQACSIFDFDGIVQHIIHHVKYKGKKDLARYIGSRYANRIPETFFWGMDVITPVPLHYFRRLKRGYNQARYLALGIMEGSAVNAAYCEDILRRVKHTRTQTKLEREARRKNLARAFTINRDRTGVVRGKGVLLVDDVVTTGATADLCAQVLLDAGAARVRVLSLART